LKSSARYFGGRLPAVSELRFARLVGLGYTFRARRAHPPRRSSADTFGIRINERLRDSRRHWAFTLFHEMVHLEQRNRYSCGARGRHFNARMKDLAARGAFNGLW
jgi:hypothetical protein